MEAKPWNECDPRCFEGWQDRGLGSEDRERARRSGIAKFSFRWNGDVIENFGGMSPMIGDRYEQVGRSPFLSRLFGKTGGASTESRRDVGDQLIAVGIFLLKEASKTLASNAVDALKLSVIIELRIFL